ncbi:MAG: type IV pilus biogenesis protein PilM [Pirellulales bacterium]
MPRLLALEWDAQEARFVLANVRRGNLELEQAGAIPLPPAPEGEKLPPETAGQIIRTALAVRKIGGAPALVVVGRSQVELRQLTLPPAPDEELPELVRNLALRELSAANESSIIDYMRLPAEPGEQQPVLAAALHGEQLTLQSTIAKAAGLRLRRLVLRPYAVSGLLARQMQPRERLCLLVDGNWQEAELSVLADGQVVVSRTVRLPAAAEGEPPCGPLLAEIRRTVIAVQNQPGGGSIEAVYVCGESDYHHDLVRGLEEELSLAAELFRPFAGQQLASGLRDDAPPNPGRYAGLIGALVDEAHGTHAIDFLHPRQPVAPQGRRRVAVLAASLCAVLALAGWYAAWSRFSAVDAEISALSRELKDLDLSVKRAVEKETAVAAIEEWSLGNVCWLDELRDLSLRFPKPRDAVVLRMTLGGRPAGGGQIDLEGLVRDHSIVRRMETSLRDDHHEVSTRRVQESVQGATYTLRFDTSMGVTPRDKTDYQSQLSTARVEQP